MMTSVFLLVCMLGINEDSPLLALPHYKAKLVNNSPGPIPPVYLLQHHHAYQVFILCRAQGEALAMASWLLFLTLAFLSYPPLYHHQA